MSIAQLDGATQVIRFESGAASPAVCTRMMTGLTKGQSAGSAVQVGATIGVAAYAGFRA